MPHTAAKIASSLVGNMQLRRWLIWPLVVLLVSVQITKAEDDDDENEDEDEPRFGVRVLLHEGMVPTDRGCDANEFEIVKTAIQSHMRTGHQRFRRSMQPVNCKFRGATCEMVAHVPPKTGAAVCCGYAYGTCVVFYPRCQGFPTPASNDQECRRRLEGSTTGADDDSEECNNMKLAALEAIMESIDGVSTDCTTFMLATRLQCYPTDEGYASPAEPPSNSGCAIVPSEYPPSIWYGAIMVGFDAPSAVVDFTGTAIDPTRIGDVWGDKNVFTSITVDGKKLILKARPKKRWLSSIKKSQINFSSHTGKDKLESLYSNGLPRCYSV